MFYLYQERKKAYDRAEKIRIEKEDEEKRVVFEENREIKQLEKHLHMNKRKSKAIPQKFVDEGLDCILLFEFIQLENHHVREKPFYFANFALDFVGFSFVSSTIGMLRSHLLQK